MNFDRSQITTYVDRIALFFGIAAAVLAVFILVLRVLIHFPFFDETLHVHYLWLFSNGYKPGTDFYCHYPSLAYLCMVPFFKLLPDSAFVVLVLRFVSLAIYGGVGVLLYFHGRKVTNDWCIAVLPLLLLAASSTIGPFMVEFSIDPFAAAAATGALVMYFRPPSERTVAVSAGLALMSVLITPKYAFPLFFGLIGHSAAYFRGSNEKLKTVKAICIGGAASLICVLAVYWLSGVSFLDNVISTMATSKTVDKINSMLTYSFVFRRLTNKTFYEILILMGILGWVWRSRNRIDQITLSGFGILLGLVLFFFSICLPLEQYQMPIYVSLAMFAPFAFVSLKNTLWVRLLRCVVVAGVFFNVANTYPALLQEFMGTSVTMRDANNPRIAKGPPAVRSLGEIDQMLRLIPKDERVVALWFNNPLLRKDLTGVTWDESPSYSLVLNKNDPNARFFSPDSYWAALLGRWPALIDLGFLKTNYPPGWYELTNKFLELNGAYYIKVPSKVNPGSFYYIRRDLMPLQ